jgi:hypothetical protein
MHLETYIHGEKQALIPSASPIAAVQLLRHDSGAPLVPIGPCSSFGPRKRVSSGHYVHKKDEHVAVKFAGHETSGHRSVVSYMRSKKSGIVHEG